MAVIDIQVPDIGDFDEVGVIEVLVKVGDTIRAEQSLVTVESDKASMEIPSSHAGVVKELKVKLGDKVAMGSVLLTLEVAGEVSAPAPAATQKIEQNTAPSPVSAAQAAIKIEASSYTGSAELDCDVLVLGSYLREAYVEAEEFSQLLAQRVKGAGFFKTLLLRRLGSSMEAGRRTVAKLLGEEPDVPDDEDDDDADDEAPVQVGRPPQGASDFKNFTDKEIDSLRRCLSLLKQGGNNDPKLEALIGYLLGTHPGVSESWLERGCILFSQYYDTVRWTGDEMAKRPEFAGMDIGLYAGSNRSGFWRDGRFQRCDRNVLKKRVREGDLKLLLGTDAASEGLNLQRLGTLINIDLPWNPTRLEQRKGRIQRIGQARSEIWIANLRYRDSVEDRVHQVLADRLEAIHGLFGQIPDTLEDGWVQVALNDEAAANQLIDRTTATRNPFDAKYSKVEDADWETCATVLNGLSMREMLAKGW